MHLWSFGRKTFHLKHRLDKTIPKVKLDLEHGSLLIMSGETQHFWQHQIPKTSRQVDGHQSDVSEDSVISGGSVASGDSVTIFLDIQKLLYPNPTVIAIFCT
ncbi:MAG: hypothetical protein R3B93_12045 [Bacteroidia bacterium]